MVRSLLRAVLKSSRAACLVGLSVSGAAADEPFYKVTGWVDGHTHLARIGTMNPGEKDEIKDVIPGKTKWYVVYQDVEDVYWSASRGAKPVKTDEACWEGLRANGNDTPSASTT